MALCTTCFNTDPIPKCINELILADTDLMDDTALTVYFENIATGTIGFVPAIADSGKVITTEQLYLPTNQYIRLWFTLEVDQANQRIPFIIDAIEYNCIEVKLYHGNTDTYDLTIIE